MTSRVDRLPRVLRTLTMMVWVWYGGCYTEIAMDFSKPRNDEPRITRLPRVAKATLAMTMWVYCYCEQSEAIHKPPLTPPCHCEEQGDEAIHNY